jgi:ABC-type dipeptide/oligopeptide/nickel transport system permease component
MSSNLARYVLRRLGLSLLTLCLVTVAVFAITNILPGNPALVRLGAFASEEALRKEEQRMGLDRPLPVRYVNFVTDAVTLDLGQSFKTERPVASDLASRLPATLELAIFATVLALLVGIPLGFLAAVRRGSPIDHVARGLSSLAAATPVFWLGLMLTFVFSQKLRIAPGAVGRLSLGMDAPPRVTGFHTVDSVIAGDFFTFLVALNFLALPALTLAIIELAPITKIARSAMLGILDTEYVRTSRAMGFGGWQIFRQDALRNALIPVVTMMGIVFGYLVSGNVIVEQVFSWPGIGRYAFESVSSNDFNAIQGFVLMVAVMYVIINLLIDLCYALIDPRIRLG